MPRPLLLSDSTRYVGCLVWTEEESETDVVSSQLGGTIETIRHSKAKLDANERNQIH